ncbi:MAG: Actin- protein 6 [Chrysothrix sp. TS-e1954]|nr:MAG: Actin- protein 6 [Chrysothrix sp. TS-e1954]
MAPRQHNTTTFPNSTRTLILDPGTHTLKAGFVSSTSASPPDPSASCHVIPNAIARGSDPYNARKDRIYIADQLDQCRDFAEMSFRRPVEKGFIVNWDGELDVWRQVLLNKGAVLECDPHDTNLLLAEPPNCPYALQSNTDQIIFEELQFASYTRRIGASLNAYNAPATTSSPPDADPTPSPPSTTPQEACLIIDASHTSTTITPILHSRPIPPAIRRLDISGRLLTNRLKELISLRHFNLMDDSWLISQVKEDTSFISLDFASDIEKTWPGNDHNRGRRCFDPALTIEYVLPDYSAPGRTRGIVRPWDPARARQREKLRASGAGLKDEETAFPLSTLRFSVPELLFQPQSIGLAQPGLPETIVQSIASIPFPALHAAFLGNIVCVGGTARLPNFAERVHRELRGLVPEEVEVNVSVARDPITASWEGGARMVRGVLEEKGERGLGEVMVSRSEYEEMGLGWVQRVFAKGRK